MCLKYAILSTFAPNTKTFSRDF